ncbi:MAG: hypothetical protein Ct9H300mP19_10610 [Dehalococcoidia bacterium]|nr:MAG: hypothetical protein Ct9H300mP19_10610 [Dehalococcoidia bacterium]
MKKKKQIYNTKVHSNDEQEKSIRNPGLSGLVGTALRKDFEERYELSSFSRYGTDGIDSAHNSRAISLSSIPWLKRLKATYRFSLAGDEAQKLIGNPHYEINSWCLQRL